ncbi:S9 family peptidase [Aquincola sp. S2]|uniref:S9 family peptidase n=1 Tax=Pseudaquabacterium terrae TaxID=2732868 RepID=A0ABX2ECM9_9BURK|nr:S9 family peptidase [Aquabacterium terrae]NRF66224.1 S9 family peptidase [Aquabacterium terrae]
MPATLRALLLALCCAAAHAADTTAPAPLPLQAFANLPLVQDVVLSPDGKRFAALMNRGDDTLLATREVAGGVPLRSLLKTDNRQFRFGWIRWVNNERLVVSVRYPSRHGWVEISETRLVSIKHDGTGIVNLVRRAAFDRSQHAQFQDQVIDWLPDDGRHVLLQLVDDSGLDPLVFRVDVETGRRTPVHGARSDVRRWITDGSHRVRVGIKQRDAKVEILVSDPEGQRWRTAWSFDVFDRDAVWPIGFRADPNRLIVQADHEGRRAVFEVDLSQADLPRKLLVSHPRFDLGGELMTAPKTGQAIGVRVNLLGDAAAGFWDADTKGLLQAIDRALPERRNRLLQFSADGSRYLLYSTGNGVPGEYYVGLREGGTLALLAGTYPQLVDKPLARKRALTISARDGTALPSYLTLPPGRDPPRMLPAVILPHGGPISNDTIDFDPWVQFLADRGYAVLQVNFRGSWGFGHEHMRAGLKRWGLDMQDDLSDAVQWLTKSGAADPSRVCIVGGSYGGYAALMGAAKTPELYRCVVSFAGVSDLMALGAHQRGFVNGAAVFERQVGSTWDDSERLKATSPRRLAAQFKAPVLLVHGTLDRSVPFEHSDMMADALKDAGKPHRFVKQEEGDHHLSNQAHRTQFFRELEAFLAEHIGR